MKRELSFSLSCGHELCTVSEIMSPVQVVWVQPWRQGEELRYFKELTESGQVTQTLVELYIAPSSGG